MDRCISSATVGGCAAGPPAPALTTRVDGGAVVRSAEECDGTQRAVLAIGEQEILIAENAVQTVLHQEHLEVRGDVALGERRSSDLGVALLGDGREHLVEGHGGDTDGKRSPFRRMSRGGEPGAAPSDGAGARGGRPRTGRCRHGERGRRRRRRCDRRLSPVGAGGTTAPGGGTGSAPGPVRAPGGDKGNALGGDVRIAAADGAPGPGGGLAPGPVGPVAANMPAASGADAGTAAGGGMVGAGTVPSVGAPAGAGTFVTPGGGGGIGAAVGIGAGGGGVAAGATTGFVPLPGTATAGGGATVDGCGGAGTAAGAGVGGAEASGTGASAGAGAAGIAGAAGGGAGTGAGSDISASSGVGAAAGASSGADCGADTPASAGGDPPPYGWTSPSACAPARAPIPRRSAARIAGRTVTISAWRAAAACRRGGGRPDGPAPSGACGRAH